MPTIPEWPLLSGLDDAARADLLDLARVRSFARNEVVCHAGEPADSLHLVESGRLIVQVAWETGATVTLNVLGPGDYFGELALLRRDHVRTATVTALEPSRTRCLAATAFQRLCLDHPRVERSLSVLLADRVDELSQRLLEALYVGLDWRVHRRLADLARIYADGSSVSSIPITQAQLAEIVGGTRPSVNQVLQRLEQEGVVALRRGRIDVLDPAALS